MSLSIRKKRGNCILASLLNLFFILVRHRKNKLRTTTAQTPPDLPPVLYSEQVHFKLLCEMIEVWKFQGENVTKLLGETVELRCTVLGYRQSALNSCQTHENQLICRSELSCFCLVFYEFPRQLVQIFYPGLDDTVSLGPGPRLTLPHPRP